MKPLRHVAASLRVLPLLVVTCTLFCFRYVFVLIHFWGHLITLCPSLPCQLACVRF